MLSGGAFSLRTRLKAYALIAGVGLAMIVAAAGYVVWDSLGKRVTSERAPTLMSTLHTLYCRISQWSAVHSHFLKTDVSHAAFRHSHIPHDEPAAPREENFFLFRVL